MKREILFRGKRKDNGEWVEGDLMQKYIHHEGMTIVYGGCVYYEVIPETVGQYTGVTDKNGKKIFEGDIVKVKTFQGKGFRGEVKFIDSSFFVYNGVQGFALLGGESDKLEIL